jgi:hypothetical protein
MKRSRFFEGLILGTVLGVAAVLVSRKVKARKNAACTQNNQDDCDLNDPHEDMTRSDSNSENIVSKTLDAIEQGFEKISDIFESKKGAKK